MIFVELEGDTSPNHYYHYHYYYYYYYLHGPITIEIRTAKPKNHYCYYYYYRFPLLYYYK